MSKQSSKQALRRHSVGAMPCRVLLRMLCGIQFFKAATNQIQIHYRSVKKGCVSTKHSSSSKHNETNGNRTLSESVQCVMCGDSVSDADISKHFKETHNVSKNLEMFLSIQEKFQLTLRNHEDVGIVSLVEVKPGTPGLGRPESLGSETLCFYSMDGEASSRSSEASSPKSPRNSIAQESARDRDTMSNRPETPTLAYQSPDTGDFSARFVSSTSFMSATSEQEDFSLVNLHMQQSSSGSNVDMAEAMDMKPGQDGRLHGDAARGVQDKEPGQDGRLHGDAARGVQEPSAGLQTQDEECGLVKGKLDIHKNVFRFFRNYAFMYFLSFRGHQHGLGRQLPKESEKQQRP